MPSRGGPFPRPALLGRLAICAVVVALAGCAALPVSGSVHVGRAFPAGSGADLNDIRVIAAAPQPGMTPARLVKGFLNALADSDGNYAVAKLYLAPGVSWHPSAGTTLYQGLPKVQVSARGIDVVLRRFGTVDARGTFQVVPGTQHVPFSVVRSFGRQWRISRLPAGILLSVSDAELTLLPATIYYFNREQTRLVPEPLLVAPDTPGLATTLIRELIDGPGPGLASAVASAIPHGTSLVGNVSIDSDGVAEVDLSGAVLQVAGIALQRLSAQIVWTLRQVPAVTAVRLLVNGAPLSGTGVPALQRIASWPQFDPDTPPTTHGALLAGQRRIVGVRTAVPTSLLGLGLTAPAVSADGSVVAAIRPGRRRTTLLVGSALGPLRARVKGAGLSPPAIDPAGDVLVVRGVGALSSLVEVPRVGSVRQVSVPSTIRAEGIDQVAVSRDGARIAMVVGPVGHTALVVGALSQAHDSLSVSTAGLVIPGAADVSGVAWAGASEIVTTVRDSAGHRSIVQASVDGYQRADIGGISPPRDPTQVAASPGEPILAESDGVVWELSAARWTRITAGADPSYAG